MGNPSAITGHSLEWQQAYVASAPQDGAQRELVNQLAIPMGASETAKQAKRVDALSAQFSVMDPRTAGSLYARLQNRGDALGQLFELTLHPATQKSLLSLLDATRHGNDRGTLNRGTQPTQPVTPVKKSPPKPPVIPPHYTPMHVAPTKQPPPQPPIQLPSPWTPPWLDWLSDDQYPAPANQDDPAWVWSPIRAAAGALGLTMSVGLRVLSNPLVEKAVEAAWLVFQTEEGGLAALYGMAGEAAAEVILSRALGVDPALVVNLNNVAANFPLVDVATPKGFFSVKVKGVASTLAGDELQASIRSQYTSDLFDLAVGGPKADGKLIKAAKGLLKVRGQLGQAWPSDLKDLTVDGVAKYLRQNARLMVPDDHVQLLRHTLGEDLYKRISSSKKYMDQLGIKNQTDLANFVDRQISRIDSLQVTSEDLMTLAETAADHIPKEQIPRLSRDLQKLQRKRQARVKLDE